MSKPVKYIFAALVIIIFLTTSVYFGYSYFGLSQRSQAISKILFRSHLIRGQLLLGSDVNVSTVSCPAAYYLVSGHNAIWLVPLGEKKLELEPYRYFELEVTGKNSPKENPCNYQKNVTNCGCDNFLAVETIKVLTD